LVVIDLNETGKVCFWGRPLGIGHRLVTSVHLIAQCLSGIMHSRRWELGKLESAGAICFVLFSHSALETTRRLAGVGGAIPRGAGDFWAGSLLD
jgi:hypothetical protein